MQTLKRTIYVGLGGAGIQSILHTKKRLLDSFGEIPPMIAFLGIDMNRDQLREALGNVRLSPSEACPISLEREKAAYILRARREEMTWLDRRLQDTLSLSRDVVPSIPPVRPFGRLAFVLNSGSVMAALQQTVGSVRAAEGDDRFDVYDSPLEINIVFSLAGATGCGIFLDVAYMARLLSGPGVDVNGYAILPEAFSGLVPADVLYANAWSALQDLDYLMQLDADAEPVSLPWPCGPFTGEDFRTTPLPFDRVRLVSGVAPSGRRYGLKEVIDGIGLTLFAVAGEIGHYDAATFDTIRGILRCGQMAVGNKRAWAVRTGASEIRFEREKLAKAYALKLSGKVIRKSLDAAEDGGQLASAWWSRHDLDEALLQENLHIRSSLYDLDIREERRNPYPVIEAFVHDTFLAATHAAGRTLPEWQTGRCDALVDDVAEAFSSGRRGVTDSLAFLDGLKSLTDASISRLEERLEACSAQRLALKQQVDLSADALQVVSRSIQGFLNRKKVDAAAELCEDAVREQLSNELAILRATTVIRFYRSFGETVDGLTAQFRRVRDAMAQLEGRFAADLSALETELQSTTFSVSPAAGVLQAWDAEDWEGRMLDFYGGLDRSAWSHVGSEEELKDILLSTASQTVECRYWQEMTVDRYLAELSEDAFLGLVADAAGRALPHLPLDGTALTAGGLFVEQALSRIRFIGVENRQESRFGRGDRLCGCLPGFDRIDVLNSGLKDRVLFFAKDEAFPPCVVDGIGRWEAAGASFRYDTHFDVIIHERMLREGYSLF